MVKIGYADVVSNRLRTLQCASPHTLTLIGSISGGYDVEAAWHKCHRADRVRGEWFKASRRLTDEIACAIHRETGVLMDRCVVSDARKVAEKFGTLVEYKVGLDVCRRLLGPGKWIEMAKRLAGYALTRDDGACLAIARELVASLKDHQDRGTDRDHRCAVCLASGKATADMAGVEICGRCLERGFWEASLASAYQATPEGGGK